MSKNDDTISRQAALDIVLEYAKRLREPIGTPKDNEMYAFGRGLLIGIERNLKQLPSAEPKKGRWYIVDEPVKGNGLYECSECYGVEDEKTDFCPYCGAKMEVME